MKFFSFISILLVFFTGAVVFMTISHLSNTPEEKKEISIEESQSSEVSLVFVGDMVLDRRVEMTINKHGGGDYRFPFLNIADYLNSFDLTIGNLEGIISDKGYNVGSMYSFRVEPEAVNGLKYAGFDILDLANNHAFDYTVKALEDCMNRLEEAGIEYIGAGDKEKAFSPLIKEINNTKIGFLAYTNFGSKNWKASDYTGIAYINNIEEIKEDIKKAKKETDVLIINIHAGAEYLEEPEQWKREFFQEFIDAGADLVVGHHPHVIQPLEEYKEGWIAYSLGNFVLDQDFSEETMKGLALEVIIEDKEIKGVSTKETQLNERFQVSLVDKK